MKWDFWADCIGSEDAYKTLVWLEVLLNTDSGALQELHPAHCPVGESFIIS